MIFGVDIGTRSFALIGLYNEEEVPEVVHLAKFFELVKSRNRSEELRDIVIAVQEVVLEDDVVFVEEPPMVKDRRIYGQLHQVAGAILSATAAQGYLVPVDSWKKATVGRGGATKDEVADWLSVHCPEIFRACSGNQNLVDAANIALYGQQLLTQADRAVQISAGSMDMSL